MLIHGFRWTSRRVRYGNDARTADAIHYARNKLVAPHGNIKHMVVKRSMMNQGCAHGMNNVLLNAPDAAWWLIVNYDVMFLPGVLGSIALTVNAAIRKYPSSAALHTFGFTCQCTRASRVLRSLKALCHWQMGIKIRGATSLSHGWPRARRGCSMVGAAQARVASQCSD